VDSDPDPVRQKITTKKGKIKNSMVWFEELDVTLER
jgi:hypothetical protein